MCQGYSESQVNVVNAACLMDISVIIVSYNVKYFLEQCLHSVLASVKDLTAEIIVVDNNSVDGSCHMIRSKFPSVRLISNNTNYGFAKACNQGVDLSQGRYVLLLNPDTVIQEDTLRKCKVFMDVHEDAGCMGVKMIDGRGRYLPESKRSLPTPAVAFYKIFGLTRLFPSSRIFGRYYLGHLDNNMVHEIDVLTGAFMFLRRTALEKAGLLDEEYFMYGEDIDLSYRIKQSGFKIYYYPETTIIHYKGESTRKASFNYVYLFYNAMAVFAGKHFSGKSLRPMLFLIHAAIFFRAALSLIQRLLKSVINPVADAVVIWTGYCFLLPVWENFVLGAGGNYPPGLVNIMVPGYILIWVVSIYLNGGYDRNVRFISLFKGVLAGSFLILLVYALLPETMRFSRALILIGALWTLISATVIRLALNFIAPDNFGFNLRGKKNKTVITGGESECLRVAEILRKDDNRHEIKGFVSSGTSAASDSSIFLGHLGQMRDIVFVHSVDEIIFCSGDISSKEIIRTMLLVSNQGVTFRIASPFGMSIIGSSSVNTAGEFYSLYSSTLSEWRNRSGKRMFDIILSILMLAAGPLMMFFVKHPSGLIKNIITTLIGKTSWVGYCAVTPVNPELPKIRKGIITTADIHGEVTVSGEEAEELNLLYAKNYSIKVDAQAILKCFRLLGRQN